LTSVLQLSANEDNLIGRETTLHMFNSQLPGRPGWAGSRMFYCSKWRWR